MQPDPVLLKIGDEEITLTEDNCWVCIFTEAPEQNHIYIYEPRTLVVFNNPEACTTLLGMGYPLQTRRLPKEWDEKAYDLYIAMLAEELEHDLEAIDEG